MKKVPEVWFAIKKLDNVYVNQMLPSDDVMNVLMVTKAILIVSVRFIFSKTMITSYKVIYLACKCNQEGSQSTACSDSGQCFCKDNVEGQSCDHCTDNHFGYPTCARK